MTSPETGHLGRLIDEYLRRHSASISGLAERIGISRQSLRQWRVGEMRSVPTQQNLKSAAIQIGCSYDQILDAALRDAGYLDADRATALDSTPNRAGAAFIHNVIVAERYSGRADNRVHEWERGPGIWTVAHRGYSGYRRLDLWAYPDEHSALKAAARLGMECGLDEDEAAAKAYEQQDYRAVLDRHRETAPEWQILTVELTHFVGESGTLLTTSAGVGPSITARPDSLGLPDAADDEELALMENDEEYSEIVELISARQATLIANAADEIANAIRSDADTLDSTPVTKCNSGQLEVLATLPSITFEQSRLWRYQLAAAADRLATDTRLWGAPIPRCTGEEMVLHLILRRAEATARPRQVRRGSWDQLSEVLFQDHDVLTLYDLPPEATESVLGGVNLHPRRWFTEFTLPFPMPERPSQAAQSRWSKRTSPTPELTGPAEQTIDLTDEMKRQYAIGQFLAADPGLPSRFNPNLAVNVDGEIVPSPPSVTAESLASELRSRGWVAREGGSDEDTEQVCEIDEDDHGRGVDVSVYFLRYEPATWIVGTGTHHAPTPSTAAELADCVIATIRDDGS